MIGLWMRRMRVLGLAGLILVAGCAGMPGIAPDEMPDGGPSPLDPESLGLPEGAVLSYQRSGGFAGLDQTWVVYADGRIAGPGEQEREVDPAQVRQLLADLEAAGFFRLDPDYEPEYPCCDRFAYVLTARSGERGNQMSAVDAVESVPAELWDSLDAVRAFLETPSQ